MKTMKIRPTVATADFDRKLKQIEKWLEGGEAVQVQFITKGREKTAYQSLIAALTKRLPQRVEVKR